MPKSSDVYQLQPDLAPLTLTLSSRSMIRITVGVIVVVVGVAFLRSVPQTLTLVTLGVVFALAFDPVVTRIGRTLHISRGLSIATVGIVVMAAASALFVLIGPTAVQQAASTSRELPRVIDNLSAMPVVGDVLQRLDAQDRFRAWVAQLPEQLSDKSITNIIQSLLNGIYSGVAVLIIGVATLVEGPTVIRRIHALIPSREREKADVIARVFYRTIGAYFAGSLLVATLAATFILVVGFSLGVPLTPLAAIWVLIVNFIPQIGGLLAASMFALLALGKSPLTAVICLVAYWIYMMIENHVIQPVVVGNAVNLSTAATMLAMLLGGTLFGIPGAILGAPIVGTAKGLYVALRHPERIEREHDHDRSLYHRLKSLTQRFTKTRRHENQTGSQEAEK